MPNATFLHGIKLAIESSRGDSPASTAWWEGGKFHDIITDGLPDLKGRQAIIFPAGHAGKRSINQQSPTPGRRWSDGSFSANVTADFIGLLLYGALGTASSDSTPSTASACLYQEPLEASKKFVLSNQPSDGGAILEFAIAGTTASNGTIVINGIDCYGNGASETINYFGNGSVYSRISWSAIGSSSLSMTNSAGDGTVSIFGYKYFTHTFSVNESTNPTFTMERIGDPQAGAASKSFLHDGMVLTELTISTPAATEDGIMMVDGAFEGNFPAVQTATTINDASPMRIWPAWTLSITKNNSSYCLVTNQTLTINTGARNYEAACGTQNPQGSFFGGREMTGSHDILITNEEEYNDWLGSSRINTVLHWDTPWKLTSSVNMSLTASLTNMYVDGDPSLSDDDGAFSLSQDFRMTADTSNDIVKFALVNGVPGVAYSTS